MSQVGRDSSLIRSVQIRSANDSETLEQDARTPHPAFGHPLPASRGEGHSILPPRVSFSPLAGRRCREAADEGLALREFGQHLSLVTHHSSLIITHHSSLEKAWASVAADRAAFA